MYITSRHRYTYNVITDLNRTVNESRFYKNRQNFLSLRSRFLVAKITRDMLSVVPIDILSHGPGKLINSLTYHKLYEINRVAVKLVATDAAVKVVNNPSIAGTLFIRAGTWSE